MDLQVFRHLWGMEGSPVDLAQGIAERGYAGIEAELPRRDEEEAFRDVLEANGLRYIAEILIEGESEDEHLRGFRTALKRAKALDAVGATVHAGRDAWPLARAIPFYRRILEIEAEVGLRAAHETHRGRPLFTPWNTVAILEAVPELRLCCDFSHWVLVAERLLEDQQAALELAARHATHLHARVGYDQGPQVPDPRAPEYAAQLETFERWWRLIWDAQRAAGSSTTTLTPEYGPPPYLHTTPHTRAPVSDLIEICDWQAARAREQFRAWRDGARPTAEPASSRD